MQKRVVACVQPRMMIPASHEELEAALRRFLRQPMARSAEIVVFPELIGLLFAPALISRFKLGFIRRADQGRRPTAGIVARSMGSVAQATADAMGGGLRGSLSRLLDKNSEALQETFQETFSRLAREFTTTIVAGSTYIRDADSGTLRNRSYVFSAAGEVLGYQDKLHMAPPEENLATAGAAMPVIDTSLGKLGILIGLDALYPELARLLAIQGADVIVGCAATPGAAQARVIRSAMALRAEENQIFATASFLIGANYLDRDNPADYRGRSALLAPISLTEKGDGILIQAGSDRTEAVISAEVDFQELNALRETGRFRPRQTMNLGGLGPVLADVYERGLSIDQAYREPASVTADRAHPPVFARVEPEEGEVEVAGPEPEGDFAPDGEPEPAGQREEEAAGLPDQEAGGISLSVPEALSLTRRNRDD